MQARLVQVTSEGSVESGCFVVGKSFSFAVLLHCFSSLSLIASGLKKTVTKMTPQGCCEDEHYIVLGSAAWWIQKSLLLVNSNKHIYHSLLFLHYKYGVELKSHSHLWLVKQRLLKRTFAFWGIHLGCVFINKYGEAILVMDENQVLLRHEKL